MAATAPPSSPAHAAASSVSKWPVLAAVGVGDMRGHKSIYAAGFVVFVLGSALCGFAPSPAFLVGSRALQAIGASMLIANSPAILTQAFPPSQRGRVLGWQATAVYLGVATGPPLGGWLATLIHWRAGFFVNVPIGF